MKTLPVVPRASMLIESMRDIGYTLETALADIIDNSITAKATSIRLFANTSDGEPSLAIVDNGEGMDEETLLQAMRLGSQSPLDGRAESDLGRFGLGLKTASFSQCRRLTIISRKAGHCSCARWDLDYVAKTDNWLLQIPTSVKSVPWSEELGQTGTLVVWEILDRLADDTVEGRKHFVEKLDEAAEHLSLVFHRFLSGERGTKRISISLNDRNLEPVDPIPDHLATSTSPLEKIRIKGREITVQAFILPHHEKVTPDEWNRYAGRAGYFRNQGFYLYRAKRLIIHGTWFGLARQSELTKLARVRIDMPNDLDIDWKIDVKKSSATPPRQVRNRLRALVDKICVDSKRPYTKRGGKLASDSRLPVWQRHQDHNSIFYRLNPDHPVFTKFLECLPEDAQDTFQKILEMAGSSLPLEDLFNDVSGHPEQVKRQTVSPEALEHIVTTTFLQLFEAGLPKETIMEMMKAAEPFRSRWVMTEQIAGKLFKEESASV